MDFRKSEYPDLDQLQSWFQDQESAYRWAGPSLRFPFTTESFLEDIHWGNIAAHSLRDDDGSLLAFGQYYELLDRCHLARLVVAPAARGDGIGRTFISSLMKTGMQDLKAAECSLFVLKDNAPAIGCYRALGFRRRAYPPALTFLEGVDFMVYPER